MGQPAKRSRTRVPKRTEPAFKPDGKGPLMAVGGAEDKTANEPILATFVELAGGKAARVAIVPTASSDPDSGQIYQRLFQEMGVKSAEIVRVAKREDANDEQTLESIREATGIYIGGGDQARLVALMAGTLASDCIRQRNAAGAVIAGTSAGASILGSHMMSGGAGTETPRKCMVEMVAGFGLLQDVIVDQHFSQRGRIGRLLVLFAANPGLLALGVDEDTAAVMGPGGMLEVVGANSVTILDGRSVRSD